MTTYTVTKTLIRHEDFSTSQAPETRFNENLEDFVYTGCLFATSASLIGTLSAGTAYINGKRVAVAETLYTFIASKDTYVDLEDDGTLHYTAVANGAAVPDLISDCVRLCKVITGAGTISSVSDMRNLYSVLQQIEKETCILIGDFHCEDTFEIPVFVAPHGCELKKAWLTTIFDITASATDYGTFSLINKGSDGTGTDVICSITTAATGFTAMDPRDMGTLANNDLAKQDSVSFKFAPTLEGCVEGVFGLQLLLEYVYAAEVKDERL